MQIIQHSKKLYLIVRSVGRIPNSFVAESTCKWVDIQGRRVFPPPGFDDSGHKLTAESILKSDLRLLRDDDECTFLYIFFLPSLHEHDMKIYDFHFMEDINKQKM